MNKLNILINIAQNLSEKDKEKLINTLVKRTFTYKELKITQINNNGIVCPYCNSDKIVGHGKTKDEQIKRYRCKDCKKTFNGFTGTSIHWIHKKDIWYKYLEYMLEGKSIRKTAEDLELSTKTVFNWRHKILSSIQNEVNFKGIVESDETYYRESQKGNKKLKRKPRKRGKGDNATKRGISKDKVAVVVSMDRNKNIDVVPSNLGRIKIDDLKRVFKGKLNKESILCSDSHHTYKGYARWRNVEHKMVNSSKKEYVREKIYHIQHVNSFHSKLKDWVDNHFRGVSTKYLHNYLAWLVFIEKIKKSSKSLEKFFDEILYSNNALNEYHNIESKYLKFAI